MTILTIHVKTHSNKRREFLQTILALTKELQKKLGCLSYHTSQDIENENIFYFVTRWQTQNELETYFQTRNFSVLLGAMHILGETSEMMINEVVHSTEMETVQVLRRKKAHIKYVPNVSTPVQNSLRWSPS
jgi:quinol monooxygenase YgiN